jgi:hypothetical protein
MCKKKKENCESIRRVLILKSNHENDIPLCKLELIKDNKV